MLLTKTVKVKWNTHNKKWYEGRGYEFTKYKDEFEVKINDVQKSLLNETRVEVMCDTCGNKFTMLYKTYCKNKNILCRKCRQRCCIICGSTKGVQSYIDGNIYCGKHVGQLKNHGRILERTIYDKNEIIEHKNEGYAEIILYSKYNKIIGSTIIDLDDVEKCRLKKWNMVKKTNNVYCKSIGRRKDKPIYLHHYILNINDSTIIDHKDGNGLNNKKSNLRLSDDCTNQHNKRQLCNNTSNVMGVSFNKNRNTWYSSIIHYKKNYYLGCYKDKTDAIISRFICEYILFKQFSRKYDILHNLFKNILELNDLDFSKNNIHKQLYTLIDIIKIKYNIYKEVQDYESKLH